MLRYKTKTRPGLVTLYDIRPGNGAGPFLQPRSPHGAQAVHYTPYSFTQNERNNTVRKMGRNMLFLGGHHNPIPRGPVPQRPRTLGLLAANSNMVRPSATKFGNTHGQDRVSRGSPRPLPKGRGPCVRRPPISCDPPPANADIILETRNENAVGKHVSRTIH